MKNTLIFIVVLVAFLLLGFWQSGNTPLSLYASNTNPGALSNNHDTVVFESDMTIHFENIENQKIKDCFIQVIERYKALHTCEVRLIQRPIKASTMQAQPMVRLSNLFGETEQYRVRLAHLVKDSRDIKVANLPEEVLTGWFAHELGHLVDYRPLSNFQMIFFGIKYLVSNQFKIKAEHAADQIAIQNGFRDEIIATKRFILENDLMGEKYKAKIRKYYMPIEEAEVWEHKHVPMAPEPDL